MHVHWHVHLCGTCTYVTEGSPDWRIMIPYIEWHELFGDFTFSSIEGMIKNHLIQIMPSRDPSDNSVILFIQMGKWNPTQFNHHQVYRCIVFVEEILLLR